MLKEVIEAMLLRDRTQRFVLGTLESRLGSVKVLRKTNIVILREMDEGPCFREAAFAMS